MLRKYKNSQIVILYLSKNITYESVSIIDDKFIIQTDKVSDYIILAEFFKNLEDFENAEPISTAVINQNTEKEAKIAEYKAVTLNQNNFNDKWSNHTLGELFQANDREFIDRAKKEMKNEYIKERIIFLDKELNGK